MNSSVNDALVRYRELIEAKFTRGLSNPENKELASLEVGFEITEQSFYGPILERTGEEVLAHIRRDTRSLAK